MFSHRFLPLLLVSLSVSTSITSLSKIKGVDYGNRFIVEDWLAKSPYDFYAGLSKDAMRFSLGDVIDTQSVTAKDRMLNWLDATIKEEHFVDMKSQGIEVVRLPCGYWNWIAYPGASTPNGPDVDGDGFHVVEKFRNVQSIASPEDYRPYFDRVFQYAANQGIKILLDLHGVPGSQNGETHSGVVTGKGDHPSYYFQSDWNKQQAVNAVGAMSAYGASKDNLFGVQVINEPQGNISHDFLADYYSEAIAKAREHLPMSVPVVLYSWAYDFGKWNATSFADQTTFGEIYWGTHIYHMGRGDLKAMKAANWGDYELVRDFSAQGHKVFVGEWTLAGMDDVKENELQSFAAWFVSHFECVATGSFFWNFDGPGTWGFNYDGTNVKWASVFAVQTDALRVDGAAFGLFTYHGKWIQARQDGSLYSSPSKSQWEEWAPYIYSSGGETKLALQSWHGKWLTAAEDGSLCANATSHSAWEEFTPYFYESFGQHRMALKSSHGKWLTVNPDGSMSATAESHAAWEELTPSYCSEPAASAAAGVIDELPHNGIIVG